MNLKPVPSAAFAADKIIELAATADGALFSSFVTAYQSVVFRWALAFASDADEADGPCPSMSTGPFDELNQCGSLHIKGGGWMEQEAAKVPQPDGLLL